VSYEGVPGLVETREALGETTLVVDPARLVEACLHLRDELGFNLLLDITATDYLGWGERPVAGLHRHARPGATQPPGARATRARPSRSRSASR
jgi:NADH:ubiquinone oxidoreductase subunit C